MLRGGAQARARQRAVLEGLGIDPKSRAEELPVSAFCRLANALQPGAAQALELRLQALDEILEPGQALPPQALRGEDRRTAAADCAMS